MSDDGDLFSVCMVSRFSLRFRCRLNQAIWRVAPAASKIVANPVNRRSRQGAYPGLLPGLQQCTILPMTATLTFNAGWFITWSGRNYALDDRQIPHMRDRLLRQLRICSKA